MENLLERAIRIALNSHAGQVDKAGRPYILHPLRLMNRMDTDQEKIVAVLHDALEDADLTSADLRAEGFSDEIVSSLELLTRTPEMAYDEYIKRIKPNPLARRIKIADLEDNLDASRLIEVDDRSKERLNKYLRSLRELKS